MENLHNIQKSEYMFAGQPFFLITYTSAQKF
jgi:hypothetical protein